MQQSQSNDTRLVKVSMAFVSGHSKENRQLMLKRLNSMTAFGEGFFFFFNLFIYGCVVSSSLCEGPPQLWQAGATLHRGVRASHYRGLPYCVAQAPDAQAQQLWLTGPVARRHVGSSQTRARTRVPCTGRQTPNHCATREALGEGFLKAV